MSYNQQREGRTQRQGQLNDPSEYGSQAMDPNPVSRAQETSGQEQGWTDKPAYQGGQRGSTGTGTGGTQYGSSTGGTQYGSSTGGTQYGSSTGGTQYGSSTDPTSGSQQYSSGEFSGPTGASADPGLHQHQQQKPGMGQKIMGTAEKAFGKMTGDTSKYERGQERMGRSGEEDY
ncbi:hypothetical protein AX17_006677 [Amanita inopinata Kibby_2008]|nr:hypothetical protein AX17_006677 [Amanita inopinata Kibby_2008]